MTPAEIDALPAGRELDALVAEKVMGWSRVEPLTQYNAAQGCPPGTGKRATDKRQFSPQYSQGIAAAWEVVEKLTADGVWELSVMREQGYATAYGVKGWTVEVSRLDGDNKRVYCALSGLCDTAPLAICRAALKAVASAAPPQ